MKRSEEVKGLSVFSISEGKEIGTVKELLVNPEHKAVDYLIIDVPNWHYSLKLVPFSMVEGVGDDAVIIEAEELVSTLNDQPEAVKLLERGINVIGTKVITKKGRLAGSVSEYYVNEETGQIGGCELMANDQTVQGIIPLNAIFTIGKDAMVVAGDVTNNLLSSFDEIPVVPEPEAAPAAEPVVTKTENGWQSSEKADEVTDDTVVSGKPNDATKLFEERQRQYMLGKTVMKHIYNEAGEIIIRQGDIINDEMIRAAKDAGKFIELMTNIAD